MSKVAFTFTDSAHARTPARPRRFFSRPVVHMKPVIDNSNLTGPMKVGSLILGFTVLVLVWLAWYVAVSGRQIESMKDRHLRFQELLGIVVHSEEVLTGSAWMGVITGDPQWQVRYREFEPKLATATQEALSLATDAGATDVVERINAASAALVKMENKAFELTEQARREEAQALLASEDYSHQRHGYAASVAEIDARFHQTIKQAVDAETRSGRIAAGIAAIALPLLLFVWIMARKKEDRWLYAQDLGHAMLLRQFTDLAKQKEGLDARVSEQTCQLDLARLEALRLLDEARQRAVELTLQTKNLRQTTERLRASEAELRTLLESMPQFVWVTGPDGLSLYFNQRWMEYTGLTLEECSGIGWLKPLHPEDQSAALEAWHRATKTDEGYTVESRLRRADGNYRWFVIRGLPLRDQSGHITKWIGTCTDIDDQKRFATELQVAGKSAEVASHVKSEFLAYISHEIRTPMNAIIGLTGLALQTPLSPEQREYLEGVMSSVELLLKLINSILDVARIEAGKLELEQVEFNLRAALQDAMKALAQRAQEKQLKLIFGVRPDVPDALIGDPSRLWQVVINLVGNALKFTQHGEITVGVELDEDTDDSQQLVPDAASVRLETAGISRNALASGSRSDHMSEPGASALPLMEVPGSPDHSVFLRFTVSDTGIGIPADRQGKLFHAFSQPESSTTRKSEGIGLGLAISARLVQLMGGRTWFESEEGRGSHFHFTARFGVKATPAPKDALRLPTDFSGCHVMPVEDQPVEWRDAIATALSLAVRPATKRYATALGTSLETVGRSLHILVAEDNAPNQLLARRTLEKARHTVVVASNGEEAVAAVGREAFDLVLMDVQMPMMDGFQATARIREQEIGSGKHQQIVAMTAHALKGDRIRCLEAGMDGYVSKPIRNQELFSAIAAVMKNSEQPPEGAAEKAAVTGPTRKNGPPPNPLKQEPIMSSNAAPDDASDDPLAGDPDLRKELSVMFLEDCPKVLSVIRNGITQHDESSLDEFASHQA